jgi:hypothetical protein
MCVSVCVGSFARASVQRACVLTSVRVLACARLRTLDCYLSFICSCVRACMRALGDTPFKAARKIYREKGKGLSSEW